jgi:hypothetical protein
MLYNYIVVNTHEAKIHTLRGDLAEIALATDTSRSAIQ